MNDAERAILHSLIRFLLVVGVGSLTVAFVAIMLLLLWLL